MEKNAILPSGIPDLSIETSDHHAYSETYYSIILGIYGLLASAHLITDPLVITVLSPDSDIVIELYPVLCILMHDNFIIIAQQAFFANIQQDWQIQCNSHTVSTIVHWVNAVSLVLLPMPTPLNTTCSHPVVTTFCPHQLVLHIAFTSLLVTSHKHNCIHDTFIASDICTLIVYHDIPFRVELHPWSS